MRAECRFYPRWNKYGGRAVFAAAEMFGEHVDIAAQIVSGPALQIDNVREGRAHRPRERPHNQYVVRLLPERSGRIRERLQHLAKRRRVDDRVASSGLLSDDAHKVVSIEVGDDADIKRPAH